jgi:hypothetical protein
VAERITITFTHRICRRQHTASEKETILIKVPKKGDLSQCRNWWGVTVLAVISKIFNKIILERIKNLLEKVLWKE